jgi:23S rRNA (guanosine2251-2'-O)-methyltransferase
VTIADKPKPEYLAKKQQYDNMITLYGRNPVLEILQMPNIEVHRLHLATSNNPGGTVSQIIALAESRNIEIQSHDRQVLSRISKNARQDQGVAIDLIAPGYQSLMDLPDEAVQSGAQLLLLDRITNPQNLGMIMRSVAASTMHGMILPRQGSARIDPLVFKASAGNLFKANIYHCPDIDSALEELKQRKMTIYGLDATGSRTLSEVDSSRSCVWVLGNESDGIAPGVLEACDELVRIPLANQVESLNVSAAATLIAFRGSL